MYFEFISKYWNHRYISSMKTCLVYHWNQNRNKAENKYSHWSRSISLFIYLFICIWLKSSSCLCKKQRNQTNLLFQHFWIHFWCLILRKYEKVYMSSLECRDISSYGQRRNVIFSWILHNSVVWIFFLDNYLFIIPEHWKTSLKI